MSDLYFLDETQEVNVPSGGGFSPRGLIAPWRAMVQYRLSWVDLPFGDDELPEFLKEYEVDRHQTAGTGKVRFYFTSREMADAAREKLGIDFPPETIWCIMTATAEVLNFFDDEIRAAFGDAIVYDVEMKTPRSKKSRHVFHLIALPLAVQAMAKLLGYIKEDVFDANELMSADENLYNDKFRLQMIGDPDNQSPDAMLDSTLGQRRMALWSALGENDHPPAYLPSDYEGTAPDSYKATSDKLSRCLRLITSPWKAPAFAEVVTLHDPRVDATFESGGELKRLRIATFQTIYPDEATAVAAAEKQVEDAKASAGSSGEASESKAAASGDGPNLPEAWNGIENDFLASLRQSVEDFGDSNSKIAEVMEMKLPEVSAWRKHLGI